MVRRTPPPPSPGDRLILPRDNLASSSRFWRMWCGCYDSQACPENILDKWERIQVIKTSECCKRVKSTLLSPGTISVFQQEETTNSPEKPLHDTEKEAAGSRAQKKENLKLFVLQRGSMNLGPDSSSCFSGSEPVQDGKVFWIYVKLYLHSPTKYTWA